MANEHMALFEFKKSRYMRNTWLISAEQTLNFSDNSCIRYFNNNEALRLSKMIQKRNVFARHSYENNFYIQRIKELSEHTIIEVFRSGDPNEMREEAEMVANQIEKLVLLSSTLVVKKNEFLKKLGVSIKPRNELDCIIGKQIQYISSKSKIVSASAGIHVDERFKNRFERCGFLKLHNYCLSNNHLAKRVKSSMDWLFESRREPSTDASIVKTSIALESLLIFSESENLVRSLSDRIAYLLSSDPDIRKRLSKIVIQFYSARSAIVHGNRKRTNHINPSLIEVIDRMCVLIYLTISSNSLIWKSQMEILEWFEMQRWGYNVAKINIPFSKQYLTNALALLK